MTQFLCDTDYEKYSLLINLSQLDTQMPKYSIILKYRIARNCSKLHNHHYTAGQNTSCVFVAPRNVDIRTLLPDSWLNREDSRLELMTDYPVIHSRLWFD